MAKIKLDIKKRGEIIATYEADRFYIKFGVIQDLYEIYEAYVNDNLAEVLGNFDLLETVTELVKETFWDITDEHIREIDVMELILDLGPQVASYLADQFNNMGKSLNQQKPKTPKVKAVK